jgi:hypothetical protein
MPHRCLPSIGEQRGHALQIGGAASAWDRLGRIRDLRQLLVGEGQQLRHQPCTPGKQCRGDRAAEQLERKSFSERLPGNFA